MTYKFFVIALFVIALKTSLPAQDTLDVSKVHDSKQVVDDFEYRFDFSFLDSPIVTRGSSYYKGRKQAFEDIKNGKLFIKMEIPPWCPKNWVEPFEGELHNQFGISVKWQENYDSRPRAMYHPPQGAGKVFSFDDGYKSVMDSTVYSIITLRAAKKIMEEFKTEYGVNSENCPGIVHRFVDKISEPKLDKEFINAEINSLTTQYRTKYYGRLFVKMVVSTSGKVILIREIRGLNPKIDSLTVEYLKGVEFVPCERNGQKVTCETPYKVVINSLENDGY